MRAALQSRRPTEVVARGLSSTPPPLETWLSTGTKSCQHVLDLHYIAALTHFPDTSPGRRTRPCSPSGWVSVLR
jgi:hypothetical protein